ncbi:MAG: rhomboid family intramembrane serine protease [Planctomycetota bacterium]|nr:MAG: rhomboid family intramembrane serine protease [Planctomycetota bacterium]
MSEAPGDGPPPFAFERAIVPEPPPAHPLVRLLRRLPVTAGLTAVTLAFFALEAALGGTTDMQAQMRLGVLRRDLVFSDGEYFRLICAAFLHHGWIHLGLNWLAFVQLGALAEQIYGSWRFFAIYIACALASSLCSAAFMEPLAGGSRGASGAIMGLAGLLLGASWFAEEPLRGSLRALFGRRLLYGVLLTFGLGVALVFVVPVVDNWGHLGGFLLGLLLSLRYRRREPEGVAARATASFLGLVTVAAFVWMAVAGGRAAARWPLDEARAYAAMLADPDSRLRAAGRGLGRWIGLLSGGEPASGDLEATLLQGMLERYRDAGRPAEGLEVLERLAPTMPDASGEVANLHAWTLLTYGDDSLRDPVRAEALARRSLDALDSVQGADAGLRLSARLDTLAEALRQQGRLDEAYRAQVQATLLARSLGARGGLRAELELRLAELCRLLGRLGVAREAAELALAEVPSDSGEARAARALLDALALRGGGQGGPR